MKNKILRFLAPLGLCAFALSSPAQTYDLTYTNLPSYLGGLNVPATNQLTYQPPGLTTLAELTNGFPTNTGGQTNILIGTNYNGVGNMFGTNAVIDIRHFDEVVFGASWQDIDPGGAATANTNFYMFGYSDDGVHFTPTNTPALQISFIVPVGATNGSGVTNISRTTLGPIGFLQLQAIAVQGTNGETNWNARFTGKVQRQGTSTQVVFP